MRPGDLVWLKNFEEWALIKRMYSNDEHVCDARVQTFDDCLIDVRLEEIDPDVRWSDITGYQSTQELIEADIGNCHGYLDRLEEDKDHSAANLVQRIERLVKQLEEKA